MDIDIPYTQLLFRFQMGVMTAKEDVESGKRRFGLRNGAKAGIKIVLQTDILVAKP